MLSFYVPERDVHRADSGGPGAGLSPRIQPIEKIVPVTLRQQRVFADEQRGDLAVDEFPRRKPLNRSRQAVPRHPAVCLRPNEHDLTYNRLVHERHLRRDAMRGCFDASNLHEFISWIETLNAAKSPKYKRGRYMSGASTHLISGTKIRRVNLTHEDRRVKYRYELHASVFSLI